MKRNKFIYITLYTFFTILAIWFILDRNFLYIILLIWTWLAVHIITKKYKPERVVYKTFQIPLTTNFKTDVPYLVFDHKNKLIEQNRLAKELFGFRYGDSIDKTGIFSDAVHEAYDAKKSIIAKIKGREYIIIFSKESNVTHVFLFNSFSSVIETQMLNDLEHEVRTPLSVIRGYSELLYDKYEDPKLQKILAASDELEAMFVSIRSLYSLNKDDAKPINLKHIYEKQASRLIPKDWIVDTEVNDLYVEMDPVHADIIMKNLIENAVKYGESEKYIAIKIKGKKLVVRDNGIGMEQKDIQSIFNKFYRARSVVDKNIKGTGLGMAIVHDIADLYNLKIDVVSEVNEFTEITVNFDEVKTLKR